ncbi:MAG: GNAT family N-acetyltransferase [Candidatus Marinimicrobia bacterium]|nr:GNAT family N-acetyltransferase [Candidatus Neomarinimicrobiota bacterium]
MKWYREDYWITDDKSKINYTFVVESLQKTYWAQHRSQDVIIQSIKNSLFLSLFYQNKQIGFSRIVTDFSVFAWIADVFIDPDFRGVGLGKFLAKTTFEHPKIKNVALQLLKTRDAHGLYRHYGFETDDCMSRRK